MKTTSERKTVSKNFKQVNLVCLYKWQCVEICKSLLDFCTATKRLTQTKPYRYRNNMLVKDKENEFEANKNTERLTE